jgi:hypothetical protein
LNSDYADLFCRCADLFCDKTDLNNHYSSPFFRASNCISRTKQGTCNEGRQKSLKFPHSQAPAWERGGCAKPENLETVLAAGARRVVIVSGILQAPDIIPYCREAKRMLGAQF